ncbi:hypothetical protein OROHE_002752 [Orobanche hederae]
MGIRPPLESLILFLPVTKDFMYWEHVIEMVPVGVTLKVSLNTCFAARFFQGAQKPGGNKRGEVVVFGACGKDEFMITDFYIVVLVSLLDEIEKKKMTNAEFFNRFRKELRKYATWLNKDNGGPFLYCSEAMRQANFFD